MTTSPDPLLPDAVLSLSPDVHAAGVARQFVDDNSDHLDRDLIADAQLLVSEIVTNAMRHGRGQIVLRVRLDPPGIGIAVEDEGDGNPVVDDPPSDATSGRGLLIVAAVASSWGVIPHESAPGKTVWFDLKPAD